MDVVTDAVDAFDLALVHTWVDDRADFMRSGESLDGDLTGLCIDGHLRNLGNVARRRGATAGCFVRELRAHALRARPEDPPAAV